MRRRLDESWALPIESLSLQPVVKGEGLTHLCKMSETGINTSPHFYTNDVDRGRVYRPCIRGEGPLDDLKEFTTGSGAVDCVMEVESSLPNTWTPCGSHQARTRDQLDFDLDCRSFMFTSSQLHQLLLRKYRFPRLRFASLQDAALRRVIKTMFCTRRIALRTSRRDDAAVPNVQMSRLYLSSPTLMQRTTSS